MIRLPTIWTVARTLVRVKERVLRMKHTHMYPRYTKRTRVGNRETIATGEMLAERDSWPGAQSH